MFYYKREHSYPQRMADNIKERITLILSDLKHGMFERNEALLLSLLGALFGESFFSLAFPC